MNCAAYVFGDIGYGYTQFPLDYTKTVLETFAPKSNAQMYVHREAGHIYYGYVRHISHNKYIGLCLLFTDLMVIDVAGLFEIFERTFAEIVFRREILQVNDDGNIVPASNYIEESPAQYIVDFLRFNLIYVQKDTCKLPPLNYAVESIWRLTDQADPNLLIEGLHKYNDLYITRISTQEYALKTYINNINKLRIAKNQLTRSNSELEKKLQKTIRQKKQFGLVFLLFLILIVCGAKLAFDSGNISSLQDKLTESKEKLEVKDNTISNQKTTIVKLSKSIELLNNDIDSARILNYKLREQVTNLQNDLKTNRLNNQQVVKGLQADNEKLRTQKFQLEQKVSSLNQNVASQRKIMQTQRKTIDDITEKNRSLEKQYDWLLKNSKIKRNR